MSYDNLSSVSQNVLKFYQQLTGEQKASNHHSLYSLFPIIKIMLPSYIWQSVYVVGTFYLLLKVVDWWFLIKQRPWTNHRQYLWVTVTECIFSFSIYYLRNNSWKRYFVCSLNMGNIFFVKILSQAIASGKMQRK